MITGLNHITLAVSDVERSFHFYKDLLGFTPLCKWPKGAYFLVGELWFCLTQDETRLDTHNPDYTHTAFSVADEHFAKLKSKLISAEVKKFKDNTSEGASFYFLDPDGHKLEIHVGDWKSRIAAKKQSPWPGTEFFL